MCNHWNEGISCTVREEEQRRDVIDEQREVILTFARLDRRGLPSALIRGNTRGFCSSYPPGGASAYKIVESQFSAKRGGNKKAFAGAHQPAHRIPEANDRERAWGTSRLPPRPLFQAMQLNDKKYRG